MWIFIAAALPWAEYGLVGLCMSGILGMLWKIIRLVGKRDPGLIDKKFVEEARKELLEEIEKKGSSVGRYSRKDAKGAI